MRPLLQMYNRKTLVKYVTVSRQQATPAQQRSYSIHAVSFEYCLLSLNGHLCKTDT